MKKVFFVLGLMGVLAFESCHKVDCTGYDCSTPPKPFVFELLDENTKENLFAIGTLDSTQIEVLDVLDSHLVGFVFLGEDSLKLISIWDIGWENQRTVTEVVLRVSGNEILNLYVDSESVSEECCSFTRYYEKRIENANYEQDLKSGIYKVFIE